MKKILLALSIFICFVSLSNFVYAEDEIIENLIIRDGDTVLFSGIVPLPTAGTVDLNDNTGTPHSINRQSVLSILNDADTTSADFSISNLEYYTSFGSLYLKCITGIVTGEKCDNWQYTVNNSYPGIGMDQNILSGGESIYIYFGQQYRVLLNTNEITTVDALTVTAEEYDYQNNIWKIRTGVTVGLTQPDPDNPWSPIEVQTSAVDTNGQAIFSEISAGSYNVGIKQDFYFPTESLIVIAPPSASSLAGGSAGSGGGAVPIFISAPTPEFNLKKAFDFLIAQQKENGSFGEGIYTDWATIAFASSPDYSDQKEKLKKYMAESKLSSSSLTDYERKAMALLALGENPYAYSDNKINYIEKIVASFDGTQFGDSNLVNDDIFALIPLASAGYTINDDIITKDIQFVLSKQKINGSWEESVDMTGATIQGLKPFESFSGVSEAILKAKDYLTNQQNNNGGWNNVYSTSWAIQAMDLLGASWIKNNKSPLDYLATQQSIDGALITSPETLENKIWATSYAIPAVLGKSWNAILHPVSKPVLHPAPISPTTTQIVDEVITTTPVKKKSAVALKNITPSAVAVVKKVPIHISQTQVVPTDTLSATAEKSGASIPLLITIIAVILAGAAGIIRVIRHPR